MPKPFKVLIIGGVAAGPKVASKIIRLRPNTDVTIVERDKILAYAGCGLPYYVSGIVKDEKELLSTPSGVMRDHMFFQQTKNIKVLNQTMALKIDRKEKKVFVRSLSDQSEQWLEYDKLVLATGSKPVVPSFKGGALKNIFTLHGMKDAEGIKACLSSGKARDVVVVGGGLIGVEITEALVRCGCRVTIVEQKNQILRLLDWEMAQLVELHLESKGVRVLTQCTVQSFEGDERVSQVITDKEVLNANMVILAVGVKPQVTLAEDAGLELGPTGAIKVFDTMRTSDFDIYAAGDCVECKHLQTHEPCYMPLGSTANKQGRVAAVNICGGEDTFPGVIGSTVCKVFDYCVARTGLTEEEAIALEYETVSVLVPAADRAHFMPNSSDLLLKLIADKKTRRLLGAQVVGAGTGDKRIDIVAMAITSRMTVDQLAQIDLCYAPPYSPVLDNVIMAANVVRNKLDGQMIGMSPLVLRQKLINKEDFVLLDIRSPVEKRNEGFMAQAKWIPMGALRTRHKELPQDKDIVLVSRLGLRAYDASLVLRSKGFKKIFVLDGGTAMYPFRDE